MFSILICKLAIWHVELVNGNDLCFKDYVFVLPNQFVGILVGSDVNQWHGY